MSFEDLRDVASAQRSSYLSAIQTPIQNSNSLENILGIKESN
jgi:hypothetical protein